MSCSASLSFIGSIELFRPFLSKCSLTLPLTCAGSGLACLAALKYFNYYYAFRLLLIYCTIDIDLLESYWVFKISDDS